MSIEKHDPWALLREARMELSVLASYVEDPDTVWPTVGLKVTARAQKTLRNRIDAALAAHRDEGSTEDVVEWVLTNSPIGTMHAYLDGVDLRVRWDGQGAAWDATRYGRCATEAEARRAATAAAKGMK